MEHPFDVVLDVLRDGFSVTEVATSSGVSRQAVHTGLKRYEEGGLDVFGRAVRGDPGRRPSRPLGRSRHASSYLTTAAPARSSIEGAGAAG